MSEKKSWRDVYKVHPAADLFPMLPEDELRKLGEDIEANGLKERIVLWSPGFREWDKTKQDHDPEVYLLDGRNRLAAIELSGLDVRYSKDKVWLLSYGADGVGNDASVHQFEYHLTAGLALGSGATISKPKPRPHCDPYAYVISKNIHRRHLTKEQQADLIVKAMKLKETDLAKMARSVKQDSSGRLQGSTKDPIKQAAVEEGKKHDISQRTIERSIAKAKGPAQSRRRKEKPLPKTDNNVPLMMNADERGPQKSGPLGSTRPGATYSNWLLSIDAGIKVTAAVALTEPFIRKIMEKMTSREDRYAFAVQIRRLGFKLEDRYGKSRAAEEMKRGLNRASNPEKEIVSLQEIIKMQQERIKTLQADLALMTEAQNTLNSLFDTIKMTPGMDGTGMDSVKWRKDLLLALQKYHPDKNSNKTFTAHEVATDIIPLLKGLNGQRV